MTEATNQHFQINGNSESQSDREKRIRAVIDQDAAVCSSDWSYSILTNMLTPIRSEENRGVFVMSADENSRFNQIKKNQAALQLIDSWLSDESSYDEDSWEDLESSLRSEPFSLGDDQDDEENCS